MSLLMFRKYAPAHAADAHIDDITYKYKVGDKIKTPDGVGTVQKKTHTNSGKPAYEVKLDKGGVVVYFEQSVSAAHDSAPKFRLGQEVIVKTKYTEPYRARIVGLWDMSKNGPYDEQGYLIKNIKVGGVEPMPEHALSLANANDAQDANGDEVIAQKNGYKLVHNTLNDGYWFYTKSGAGWGLTATNKVAAVNEFNRLVNSAKDAAQFKVGDLVRMNEGGLTGKITKIEPNGHFRVSFLYNRANGFSQSFSANEIVMVKPAKDSAAGAQDAADADKSEELEREIKGDVVAVVSGNAARVSKDVPFATAKEGVESFARKNGVSVVASQEYGEAYKFKFSAAIDCAADSASGQDDDASDVKFAKEQLAVFQGISTSVVQFRMTTPNGTKFAKAYRLAKEILDSVYEIETELKHFV